MIFFYHEACYKVFVNEYNRVLNKQRIHQQTSKQSEESPQSTFYVKDLERMYLQELKSHGMDRKHHTSSFKDKLISNFPNLVCPPGTSKLMVSFEATVGVAVRNHLEKSYQDITMMRTIANMIRPLIFSQKNEFTGNFANQSQSSIRS